MTIELTTVLQHANTVGTSQADSKKIFINDQGNISEKSGLGFFKRHFSTSAKQEENRATLQAFQDAILADPKYRTQLETEQVTRFFQTKREQGTPLTARDVQFVGALLEIEKVTEVGEELAGLGLIPDLDALGFSWFCVGKGMKLDSPDGVKDALKAYYMHQHCDAAARKVLTEAGVSPQKFSVALDVLKASSAWTSAMNEAFAGDLNELTHSGIMETFGSRLKAAAELLGCMSDDQNMSSRVLREIASSKSPYEGILRFNKTLEAISGGLLTVEEGPSFILACGGDFLDLTTPAGLLSAVGKYLTHIGAEGIFTTLAKSNNLPKEAGKNLAHNEEFMKRVDKALLEELSSSREQIHLLIERIATEFLAEKNDDIRALLALPGKIETFGPQLRGIIEQMDEKFICLMITPLLAAPALLNHLLDPEKGTDENLLGHLENFQFALVLCQHSDFHGFTSHELGIVTEQCLALTLGAINPDDKVLDDLLASAHKHFSVLAPSMKSVEANLRSGKLKGSMSTMREYSINYTLTIMNRIAVLAQTKASAAQRETLGIDEDTDSYLSSLGLDEDGDTLPLGNVHQSVRAFIGTRGVHITQADYKETVQLSLQEAAAFTQKDGRPAVTELLITRASAIAAEIGLTDFNPAHLDPEHLHALIRRAVSDERQKLLSPAQARVVSEQAIRDHLLELKPAIDFIKGLPTEPDPDIQDQFVITPAEKQSLLRVIPGSPLRNPEMIKAALRESRHQVEPLKALTVPGLNPGDMYAPLLTMGSTHLHMTGTLHVSDKVADERNNALGTIVALALDALQLHPDQITALYAVASGDMGLKVGHNLMRLGSYTFGKENAGRHTQAILLGMKALEQLLVTIDTRLGIYSEIDPLYFNNAQHAPDIRDIPGDLYTAAEKVLHFRSTDLPGFAALSRISPKLTHAQWDTLINIMEMAGKSVTDPHDHDALLNMIAANAPELLAAARENREKPLRPAQIWRTILGNEAPQDITEANLGLKMYASASSRILARIRAIFPDKAEELKDQIPYSLSNGIPFQVLDRNYQPGGRLGMADLRFGPPPFPTLAGQTINNAYGLVTDWQHRAEDADGDFSSTTMQTAENSGSVFTHMPLSAEDNTPDNPVFKKIIDTCHSICAPGLQFNRVMQCLSHAGTFGLCTMAETFPGFHLAEHGHFNTIVTPSPKGGDIIVTIANGPKEHPFGAHVQFTVSSTGEMTLTDIGLELRG